MSNIKLPTPSFWIDAETREVRMCAEQFHTWLNDVTSKLEAVQGILERPDEGTIHFSDAVRCMNQGKIVTCQGVHYRIKDGELQCMRELDDDPYVLWFPAAQQSIDWAIRQEWEIV